MWPTPKHIESGDHVVWFSHDAHVKVNFLGLSDDAFASLWTKESRIPEFVVPAPEAIGSFQTRKLTDGRPPPCPYIREPLPIHSPEEILQAAFQRLKFTVLNSERFIPDKFHPRFSSFEPDLLASRTWVEEISIDIYADPSSSKFAEAYKLSIEGKTALISAASYLGGLHALTTLQQLFYNHSQAPHEAYTSLSPIVICDAPNFTHRGLHFDIARNRIYPTDALRTLTAMAACKLNRFHIHATDSQSWPLDIPSVPGLAEKGAYSADHVWTEADLKLVQRFGAERGIEVYVEIDMPSHMGAVAHSYPDLTVAYGLQWDKYAVEPPAGQLKLAEPKARELIGRVLDDVIARTKHFTPLFHIGMDELNLNPYLLETGLETNDKEKILPYLQTFLSHAFDKLAAHGATPLGWQELALDYDGLAIPPDTIIQVWRDPASVLKVLEKGYRVIASPATHWYMDTGLGTFLDPDPANSDETPVRPPYHDWIPPYKNFRLMLSYDPLAGVPESLRRGVLGGEAACWGELTDSVNLDPMLWPRAAAAAEVLWAGKGQVGEDSTRRLAEWRERIVLGGVRAGMVQMEWVLRNRGGGLQ